MAAPDNTPGSQIPTGPSANQNATRNQKDLIDRLGQGDQISNESTKGEASNVISSSIGQREGPQETGAARDDNPGSQIPTGPSANQDATRNQKDLIDRLGAGHALPEGASKGQASEVISDELDSRN